MSSLQDEWKNKKTFNANSPMHHFIEKMVSGEDHKTPRQFLFGEGIFASPIIPAHLFNLLIRSQLCPLNSSEHFYEMYEHANMIDLQRTYLTWLLSVETEEILATQ